MAGIEYKDDMLHLDKLNVGGAETSVVDSPEFVKVETDAEGKVINAITKDGEGIVGGVNVNQLKRDMDAIDPETIKEEVEQAIEEATQGIGELKDVFSVIEDPEGRSEITTDSEGKILSYRDSEGAVHENVGIESAVVSTNSLNLTTEGMTEFQQALKDAGFQPGGAGDYSDKSSIQIPMPRLVYMNITNINEMPQAKGVDLHAYIEVYDSNGNYFKKKGILNAQGNSSLGHAKKNFAVDWCEDDWIGDDTTNIKIGKWVTQDSHHFKAYYTDFFNGIPVVLYQWFDEIVKTRGIYNDRNWKRALVPANVSPIAPGFSDDYKLTLDTGARCFPDGIPCIVYFKGEYYGIFCWQLKKHRDNYHQTKDNAKHLHLDGNLSDNTVWYYVNGNIDWKKWAGVITESPTEANADGVEIRNPKGLVLRNGDTYDFDTIHILPSDTDVINVEIVGEDNPEYATLMAAAEAMTDAKKRKKRIAALKCSAESKVYLENLTRMVNNFYDAIDGGATTQEMREMIATYLDVESMIDYQIFCDITGNIDGVKKNWQWNTWDGVKWAVSPYDLDWTIGMHGAEGSSTDFWGPTTVHYAGRVSLFITQYYDAELKARYKELRDAGIISVDRITRALNDWTLNIGVENYNKELEKWPNRIQDSIYRVYTWLTQTIVNMDVLYNYNQN